MSRSVRRMTSITLATALAAPLVPLLAAPASAAELAVNDATLTWKVNDCAFAGAFVTTASPELDSCKSIREDQTLSGNVSKESDGWRFTGGSGTFDPQSGVTSVTFAGSLRLGNTSQGNYYVELVNPAVVVDADGDGDLTAEVTYKAPGPGGPVSAGRLLVADLPAVPDAFNWTVTPPWESVGTPDPTAPLDGKQFADAFVAALPSSMRNWFRASTSAQATDTRLEYNSLKRIADVSLVIPDTRTWTPTVQVVGADGIRVGETRTVTVIGRGFDPAKQGGSVAGIYVVFGPNPAATANGYTDQGMFGAAQYLPAGPDANGEFQTTLTISGTYTDSNQRTWSAANEQLGVSTWAAHRRATTAWDSFAAVTFAPAATEPTVEAPRKVSKPKVKKVRGNKVTVTWGAPGNPDAVSGYQVRVSKRNSKAYRSWKVVNTSKAVLKGVGKSGTYRIQIRAVGPNGVSAPIVLKFRR